MPEFTFGITGNDEKTAGITGSAESADGRIRAVISPDGRLRDLNIAPEVLQRGKRGDTAMDSATLATEITRTINAAFDDLVKRSATAAMPNLADAEAGLRTTASDVELELNRITADLERAQRRLNER